MAATLGIMPCGHAKEEVIPVLWRVLELFKSEEKGVWVGISSKDWEDLVGMRKGLGVGKGTQGMGRGVLGSLG